LTVPHQFLTGGFVPGMAIPLGRATTARAPTSRPGSLVARFIDARAAAHDDDGSRAFSMMLRVARKPFSLGHVDVHGNDVGSDALRGGKRLFSVEGVPTTTDLRSE